MSNRTASIPWPKATKPRPCPICGHTDRCNVAPDGGAAVCWRNGGRTIQVNGSNGHSSNGNGNLNGTTPYIGAAHRPEATRKQKARAWATREAAIESVLQDVRRDQPSAEVAQVFEYQRPDGSLSFCVVRLEWPGDKTFRPVHSHDGEWFKGDPAGLLPLYRRADLPADSVAWVCEGEKAADGATSIGLEAFTSAHGSSAPEKSDWRPLAGRDVVILPDADEPGEKYARSVAAILAKLDPPARVRILRLPGLPESGDICEFIDARDSQDSEAIALEIVALAEATPFTDAGELLGGPVLYRLVDVESRPVNWLWKNRIPRGRITLGAGRPGCGKSFVAGDISACVTTGRNFPDGAPCEVGDVLLAAPEDDAGDTHRPRLEAAGADLSRVHLMTVVRRFGDDGKPHDLMFTLDDLRSLETALERIRPALVIFDPIGSLIGGDVESQVDNKTRAVLAPVAMLLAKYNAAGLVIAHTRKATARSADDLVMGSRAFTGIARVVWHFSRDPQNPARRLFLPGKNNLAPEGDGLAFTIEGQPVGHVVWEPEPVKLSADEALAAENDEQGPGRPANERKEAEAWLQAELADLAEHKVETLRQSAKDAGLAWRTVQRARREIGAIVHRDSFGGAFVWRLPKPGNDPDAPCVPPCVPTDPG